MHTFTYYLRVNCHNLKQNSLSTLFLLIYFMPGKSYHRQLGSLFFCLYNVFEVFINSLINLFILHRYSGPHSNVVQSFSCKSKGTKLTSKLFWPGHMWLNASHWNMDVFSLMMYSLNKSDLPKNGDICLPLSVAWLKYVTSIFNLKTGLGLWNSKRLLLFLTLRTNRKM